MPGARRAQAGEVQRDAPEVVDRGQVVGEAQLLEGRPALVAEDVELEARRSVEGPAVHVRHPSEVALVQGALGGPVLLGDGDLEAIVVRVVARLAGDRREELQVVPEELGVHLLEVDGLALG